MMTVKPGHELKTRFKMEHYEYLHSRLARLNLRIANGEITVQNGIKELDKEIKSNSEMNTYESI